MAGAADAELSKEAPDIAIRFGAAKDAAALAGIFAAAVHGIASRYYSPEQIAAWCPERPAADVFWIKFTDGRLLWVSVDKADKPLAFVDLLPDGHIDMLFCHPHMAGQGHAAALYDRLDHSARQQGLDRLSVDASAAARGFFTRQGFATAYRRVFQRNGVVLHNYRMIKKLN